ncbi:MAG: hypothetical protein ACFB10_03120 [Salibacteraceae bacterium]
MKLRIKDDSIRMRLTQSEIQQLDASGKVTARINFSSIHHLNYSLIKNNTINWIEANYKSNSVEINLPANLAQTWISTDQVGLEHQQDLGNGKHLQILVEKDFHCLIKRPNEDESDHFPNPLAASGS